MGKTILSVVLFAAVSAFGEGYISSIQLPDGTTMTIQDEGARQEIQGIFSNNYLTASSIKAGSNVTVATNAAGEVTISTAASGDPNYSVVSNAAMNALSRAEAEAGFTEWTTTAPVPSGWYISHPEFWILFVGDDEYTQANTESEDATEVTFSDYTVDAGGGLFITPTFTRSRLPTMADIPTNNVQLVNGAKYVTAVVTNGLASTNEVVLTPVYGGNGKQFSEWVFSDVRPATGGYSPSLEWGVYNDSQQWLTQLPGMSNKIGIGGTRDQLQISYSQELEGIIFAFTATRTRTDIIGYTLGTQTDKALASTNAIDYTISNTVLTNTIATVAQKPDLTEYVTTNALRIAVTNLEDQISKATPANYSVVSNAAMNAVQRNTFTNDVCNIVTNTVSGWSDWEIYTNGAYASVWTAWSVNIDQYNYALISGVKRDYGSEIGVRVAEGTFTDRNPVWGGEYEKQVGYDFFYEGLQEGDTVRAVRHSVSTNVLGLARLEDIPSLTNYATRAELEAGWWSEWTFTGTGTKIISCQWDSSQSEWVVKTVMGETLYIPGDEDDSRLEFMYDGGLSTGVATRHYIAGPVPQKPEDIGAQPLLTFDTTPTAGSDNPVTSGGVKTALDGKRITIQVGGGDYTTVNDTVMLPSDTDGTSTNPDAVVLKHALDAVTKLTPVYSQTPTFSEWTFSDVPTGVSDMEQPVFSEGSWDAYFTYAGEGRVANASGDIDAVSLSFAYSSAGLSLSFTATRTSTDIIGYTLGSHADIVLVATNNISSTISNIVISAGYATTAITNGLASTAWVLDREYVTKAVTNGLVATSTLSTVATTGNYNDLSNKPTKVSDFTNDSGYITSASLDDAFTTNNSVLVSTIETSIAEDNKNQKYDEWFPGLAITDTMLYSPAGEAYGSVFQYYGAQQLGTSASGYPATTYLAPEKDGKTVIGIEGLESGNVEGTYGTLHSLYIPSTIRFVGEYAFASGFNLQNVNAYGVEQVRNSAFRDCTSLATVYMPYAKAIEDYAFANSSIMTLLLPSAETIGMGAFSHSPSSDWSASNPWSLNLPSVRTVGEGAFENDKNLTNANLRVATTIGKSAFANCRNLKAISLNYAESISEGAFSNCESIVALSLPKAKGIGERAFANCTNIQYIGDASSPSYFNLPEAVSVGSDAFLGCGPNGYHLVLPKVKVAPKLASTTLQSVSLDSMDSIPNGCFAYSSNLTQVAIGNAKVIGEEAFKDCTRLEEITSWDSVTTIKKKAFYEAFKSGSDRVNISAPNVTSIGEESFVHGIFGDVLFPNATTIGQGAFAKSSAYSYSLPSLVEVASNLFTLCSTTNINIGAAAQIKEYAFYRVNYYTSPAYQFTVNMTNVTIIGNSAFRESRVASTLSCPSVTRIEDYAFRNCETLQAINLDKVEHIGSGAFGYCTALQVVNFGATARESVPTLGHEGSPFSSVPLTCKFIIPDEQYDAWKSASGWDMMVNAGYQFVKYSDWNP